MSPRQESSSDPFLRRRQRLLKRMAPHSIALIPAGVEKSRNNDVHYPFRQQSDFYYLTGFREPEALAILAPGRDDGEYLLFCRPKDPNKELWEGRRAGTEGAISDFGAHEAHTIDTLDEVMPELLTRCQRVYYSFGADPELDQRLFGWINRIKLKARSGLHAPSELVSLDRLLHEMRLIKDRHEIDAMAKAAEISAEAHRRAMTTVRPGLYEYEMEAELLHTFRRYGCEPAYPSIVAGGANGCILHYTENDAPLADGDLLLIDAGAEFHGYAGDITRTFPINGHFSPEQRQLYDLVLKAQLAAIAEVRPGNSFMAPHDAAVQVITRGLIKLGLLKGKPARLIQNEKYKTFFMHKTGHWLGLDVHDVGDYKEDEAWRALKPGMVVTVEPGIYVAPESEGVEERWWGIGIRIEDDVLVTRDEPRVLSAAVPKVAEEIEALMGAVG